MDKFKVLLDQFKTDRKVKIGVVSAEDEKTLETVFDSPVATHLEPVLIGNPEKIKSFLGDAHSDVEIVPAYSEEEAAQLGVALAKKHEIDVLMKGHIQSRTFLKAVVNKEHGIASSGLLNHVSVMDIPAYHKLLLTTDGGMIPTPSFDDKLVLIARSVQLMHKMNVKKPRVALLAAAENVNPRVPSSVEAFELMEKVADEHGDECYIDGPISFDLAVSPEIAAVKEYTSDVAGQADILIGPDLTAMNVLGKSLTVMGHAKMAGIVQGASLPIVMTSRGSDETEKMYSILLAMYSSQED